MAGHGLREGLPCPLTAQRDPEQPYKGASAHPTPLLCILCPHSPHTNLSGLIWGQASSPDWEPPGHGLSHPGAQHRSSNLVVTNRLVATQRSWLGPHPPGMQDPTGGWLAWAPL